MNSRSLRNAQTIALLAELSRLGQNALASSTIRHRVGRTADETAAIARQSRLGATIRWSEQVIRASWLYRWLTTEPEPDVVVIDLRETAVVGPILALLDRLLASFARNWQQARTGTLVARLSERFAVRPIQIGSLVALVAILTNLFLLLTLGSLSRNALGAGLVAAALALTGTRVTLTAEELTETGTYRLLVALLSPPEPPDRD